MTQHQCEWKLKVRGAIFRCIRLEDHSGAHLDGDIGHYEIQWYDDSEEAIKPSTEILQAVTNTTESNEK